MICLTYSIFYNQNEWYNLLKLTSLFKEKYFKTNLFFLRLSYERGPHIEYTIQVENQLKDRKALLFADFFKDFISNNPSDNKKIITKSDFMFKDFTNNSVHFGIHDCSFFHLSEIKKINKYDNSISEIVLSIYLEYKNQTIDNLTEIIIQVIAIVSLASKKNNLILVCKEIIKAKMKNHNDFYLKENLRESSEYYDLNKDGIIEYFKDILDNSEDIPDDGWEKNIYDLILDSPVNNIEELVINDICDNINYHNIIAFDMTLKVLKNIQSFNANS